MKKKEGNLLEKAHADAQTQWLISLIERWKDEINEMEEAREDRTGRILSRWLKLKGERSGETAVYMLRCAFVFSKESEDKCAAMQNVTEAETLVINWGVFLLARKSQQPFRQIIKIFINI